MRIGILLKRLGTDRIAAMMRVRNRLRRANAGFSLRGNLESLTTDQI